MSTPTQLPAAVQRKVARSVELSKAAAAAQAPAAAPSPAASPASPATPSAEERLKTLEQEKLRLEKELEQAVQREKVTRGRYEAEVPRLQTELKTVKDTLTELERTSQPVVPGKLRSLSDDERTFAGEQMLNLITKAAREIAQDEVRSSLKPVSEQINVLQRQTEAGFFATLDAMCPGWEEQNNDPAFLLWLRGTDPATGRSRFDRLKTAEAQFQGYLASDIFNAYREKREIGARTSVAPQPLPDITPPSDGAPGTPPIEAPAGRMFTKAEITAFYREKREGVWKGREAEARAFELEIFAARNAGRVQ